MKKFYFVLLMVIAFGHGNANALDVTLPSSVITYPHNNAYHQEGTDMNIRVYSTGTGGTNADKTITNVEFFVDGSKVHETGNGESNTYSFLWENLQAGTYRITARATDDENESFTSAGVLVTVGTDPVVKRGMSAGKGKYLGNIIGYGGVRNDYLQYWNGVTAENGSKWGVIEGTRDNMNWTNSDAVYNYANSNNLVYRYHAIAWGSQYPSWIEGISSDVAAFRGEVEEYMAAIAGRYEYIDQIDVLNENLYLNTYNGEEHAAGTPYFREGLGGPGETGYDWAIWLFEKAREYFPDSKLVVNDFELENNPDGINEMLDLVKVLRDRGLVDGFGTQAHTFNVDGMASQPGTLKSRIDLMASGGVPVYVTELDLTGNSTDEASQLYSYQQIFPVYWEHLAVAGITLWGYVEGSTWKTGTGLLNQDGSKRDALVWLENYMAAQPEVGYPYSGSDPEPNADLIMNGEFDLDLMGWSIQNNSGASGTMEVVTGAGMSGDNALKVCPDAGNPGTENWHVQVRHEAPIENGKEYAISFSAKADDNRILDVAVQMDNGGYTTHFGATANITTNVQEFSYSFLSNVDDASAKLKFYVGTDATCVYIDKVKFLDMTTTSIDGNTDFGGSKSFNVYPNPFSDELLVEMNEGNGTNSTYQIMDVLGSIVDQGILEDNRSISTSHLFAGIYFIRIGNESGVEVQKIIKR